MKDEVVRSTEGFSVKVRSMSAERMRIIANPSPELTFIVNCAENQDQGRHLTVPVNGWSLKDFLLNSCHHPLAVTAREEAQRR